MRLLGRPVPAALATAAALAPLTVALVLVWTPGNAPAPVDSDLFGPAGAALLTGRWDGIFADPIVQAGPFELAPFGIAQLAGVHGRVGWAVFVTLAVAATAFLVALVLRAGTGVRASLVAGAGTAVLCGTGAIVGTWTCGHPSEVLIPVCWVVAARLAVRDRPLAAAALVAASSGFEVWGVLGAPIVLLAGRPRLLRSATAGLAVAALVWVPLVAAGPFRMFAFHWPVLPDSLLHLIDPAATAFPWPLRLLQAVFAMVVGAAVALLLRSRAPQVAAWAVPAVVVAARLVLDPVLADYYWSPVAVCAIGLLGLAAARHSLPLAAAGALLLLASSDVAPPVPRAAVLVLLVLIAAAVARRVPAGRTAGLGRRPAGTLQRA